MELIKNNDIEMFLSLSLIPYQKDELLYFFIFFFILALIIN